MKRLKVREMTEINMVKILLVNLTEFRGLYSMYILTDSSKSHKKKKSKDRDREKERDKVRATTFIYSNFIKTIN